MNIGKKNNRQTIAVGHHLQVELRLQFSCMLYGSVVR